VSEGVVDDIEGGLEWDGIGEDGRECPCGRGFGDGDGADPRSFCAFCAFWQSHLEG